MLSHENSTGENKANANPKGRRAERRSQYCANTSSAVDRDARLRLGSLASTIGTTIHRRVVLVCHDRGCTRLTG